MARDDVDELEQDEEESEDEEVLELGARSGRSTVGFLVGFVLGALVGAGAALLAAPERGQVTRSRLRRGMRRMRDGAVDRVGEIRDDAEREIRRARRRVRKHLPD
ncbi:MAG: YtxH domain-containing protein [Gemmatimonadota bacterium]|nr:YtxH domain-containing protein [Gemmatimonadota bacterium]MDH4350272.1 YtxH domain-containing protein [Gemmatimonadota bacterium]MDH5198993.1 YtxH domain-containing protein [Gemmatimonadota bacterium]